MRIVIIGDTHCQHSKLSIPEGDVIIHCGDFTKNGTQSELQNFINWLAHLPIQYKIIIVGNHDPIIDTYQASLFQRDHNITVLRDNQITLNSELTIGGYWNFFDIPKSLDILVTHYPPKGILDEVPAYSRFNNNQDSVSIGNSKLLDQVLTQKPKYHLFGHNHNQGGLSVKYGSTTYINCAVLDDSYNLVRQPIVMDFP